MTVVPFSTVDYNTMRSGLEHSVLLHCICGISAILTTYSPWLRDLRELHMCWLSTLGVRKA